MLAGIDEAGRGPFLGPMVVAGVVVGDESQLLELGVRDSKKLSPKRRKLLASEIRAVAEKTAMVVLSASDIDDGRARLTLNEIEVGAFAAVGRRLEADEFVLDAADTSAQRFGREFTRRLGKVPAPRVTSMHKADELRPVVGAASILAKVERDERMASIGARLEREIGTPVGSGYPSDAVSVAFLKEYVRQTGHAPADARTTWKPVRMLLSARRTKALTAFGVL